MRSISASACILVLAVSTGCVKRSDYDQKAQEAEAAKKEADTAKAKLADDEQQISQLKGSLGIAQSQAITDEQKAQLEDAKRAIQEAQERGKLLTDLEGKFKQLIDAGSVK